MTFGELADAVARAGGRLRGRGLRPGDRALLFVPMSIDLYVWLLGVLHAGGTAVFVDAWAGRRRLKQAVAAAAPRAFVGSPRAQLLRLWVPSLRRIPIRLLAARFDSRSDVGASDPGHGPAVVDPESPALVTFTTGTTGRPKAAARSHAFLWAQHRVLAGHLGAVEGDVDMPTLPVFVLNNLALGVTTVIPAVDPRRPHLADPAAVLAQMRDEGVTTTSGSPAFYDRLSGHGTLPVRALHTGGAPVFPPLAARLIEAAEGRVTVLYGSTEAEPIAAIDAAGLLEAAREPGAGGVCAGAPVPEIDWKIIRPVDGPVALGPGGTGGWAALEVEPGEAGELVVAGPHVLRGYLDDPTAEAASKIRDGDRVWHRTGDGARFDGRRLWLMGRVSERVERDGRRWWSMAVEARALAVEGVAMAAYLAVDGTAVLCVEPGGVGTAIPPGLEARLREAVAPAPVDRVHVLDALPRDPRHASRVDAGALRERLARRR